MKKILSLILVIFSLHFYSQAPQKMSYQAAIYNTSNVPVTNSPVGMRISILQGSANGTVVYSETQAVTTNANGLVSLEIGNGTVVTGTFSAIGWAAGPFFIKTETDPAGGTNYSISGTSQLLSVPYALYAETSGSTANAPLAYASVGGTTTFTYDFTNTVWAPLADLTTTITLAQPAMAYVSYIISVQMSSFGVGGPVEYRLMVNGVENPFFRQQIYNSGERTHVSNVVNLGAGTNVITVEYKGQASYLSDPTFPHAVRNLTVKELRQ